MTACPCGSKKNYINCCGACIEENKIPHTPEELMRSRYTAYTQQNIEYIAHTMKPPASNLLNTEETREWMRHVKWLGLKVITSSTDDKIGYVEFIADLNDKGEQNTIHEISEFHFQDGRWYYVDGKLPKHRPLIRKKSLNRNDICECGSGKKYKKCCGKTT